ncbi:MAG: DUF998 domain-containing protein [Fervidicoccaceae archaeon]
MTSPLIVLGYAAPLVPLIAIVVAIASSPWFSLWHNALSDLGHATMSGAAPVFNGGLVIGGALICSVAASLRRGVGLALASSLWLVGAAMSLVGAFDEVYGELHFLVSVAFFSSLALLLSLYAALYRALGPLASLAAGALVWIAHGLAETPPGVALPELVSVGAALPWYYALLRRGLRVLEL